MLPKTESLIVEFKSDRNKISDTEIVETIVGFANTQGGKLYIGIEDDGTVSGLNQSRKNLSGLAALIANHTVPPQSVRVEMIEAPRNVMIVEVPASPSIVGTASGKVLRRRLKADGTPETIPMYPHEYVTRLSGLRLLDYSAQVILDSSYNDWRLAKSSG
ncbi:helix-turn-helix domain-containing protein [Acidaminobacter sp.]|uniref:AlbA family DNA-binding domain-containing protein n=1 Tax=Acidaminobacter sp. TaxID=1872102 RepID=UPI002562EA5A|nr:ATP-binding protein [Acidaminobacter sp.]MDK9712175.1 ATP-binding protein [Acidaminobacter sp.]